MKSPEVNNKSKLAVSTGLGIDTVNKIISFKLLISLLLLVGFQPAFAATTGAVFAGGCPEDIGNPCVPGSNATETNVALVLGVDEADVTEILGGFSFTGLGQQSGTWQITDTSITHLAFKSNGYYILGELTATSGEWDNDTSAVGGWDITIVDCPDAICMPGRAYEDADFLNNGGEIANLSNVRAFSVVPVPAAVWLFGSGLFAMFGWSRRKAVL